ncbi:MAG: TetR/AcrR family transcriptional regulator [Chloroflexi bacterium]|nr:TetR/AcrR family transcriptional regulator [Chloroflexota bacterium]
MARKKAAERRHELSMAAQQLFYTKGYEKTSINDIINAVGVSKGAFYHHFESKTAVLEAIVSQIMDQAVANIQVIIADETLSAIPKWQKMMQHTNSWTIERKAELIATSRQMRMDENILLRHKFRLKMSKIVAAETSKIVAQGVEEGVFNVEHIEETAVILFAIIETLSENVNDLLLNPDQYSDPVTIALQKNVAVQTAVERLLGAPSGSMPIIDDDTLIAWFARTPQ